MKLNTIDPIIPVEFQITPSKIVHDRPCHYSRAAIGRWWCSAACATILAALEKAESCSQFMFLLRRTSSTRRRMERSEWKAIISSASLLPNVSSEIQGDDAFGHWRNGIRFHSQFFLLYKRKLVFWNDLLVDRLVLKLHLNTMSHELSTVVLAVIVDANCRLNSFVATISWWSGWTVRIDMNLRTFQISSWHHVDCLFSSFENTDFCVL